MSQSRSDDFIERMLDDPLVQLLMSADHVDRPAMVALLRRTAANYTFAKPEETPLSGPRYPEHPEYRRGVGIILLNSAGRVFVGRRVDLALPAWQMPQGGIDGGETPRQAALRELREETSVTKVEVMAETDGWLRYDYPAAIRAVQPHRGQQQKWFAMLHLGDESEIDVATAFPEFSAWCWASPDQLPSLIVAFKRQLYRDVADAFSNLPPLSPSGADATALTSDRGEDRQSR